MTTTQLTTANFYALTPDRSAIIPCHNLASARAYAAGRAPAGGVEVEDDSPYNALAFVSPTGQYYVMINCGSFEIRMDVANASTARHYARNGVSPEVTADALYENTNR